MVFNNLSSIYSNPVWVAQVTEIVVDALVEESVEVQLKARDVLSGMIHCEFVNKEMQEKLLVRGC